MEIPDKDLYLPQLQFARFGYQVMGFGSTTSRGVTHLLTEGWFGSRHLVNGSDITGHKDRIQYKSSTSDDDAEAFANLIIGSYANAGSGAVMSKARGIAGQRYDAGSSAYTKDIDYYA